MKLDFQTYLYPIFAIFLGIFIADQLLYDMIFTNSNATSTE